MAASINRSSSKLRVSDHPVFSGLNAADAKMLRKSARPMAFPQGATIQVGGSVDRRCFVVFDGLVELSDDNDTITCGPGGSFGDAGSYGRALPATAIAKTHVRTFVIPSLVMAQLLVRDASMASKLAHTSTESTPLAG